MDREEARRIAKKIAWSHLGRPYLWGGDDPMAGFDCSGFVIEILKSVGILPRSGDWTAETLHSMFHPYKEQAPYNGCLVFWHNSSLSRIIHVEYCLNSKLSIGASGGGSNITSAVDAIEKNAYVKVRPINSRSHIAGYVDPFMRL